MIFLVDPRRLLRISWSTQEHTSYASRALHSLGRSSGSKDGRVSGRPGALRRSTPTPAALWAPGAHFHSSAGARLLPSSRVYLGTRSTTCLTPAAAYTRNVRRMWYPGRRPHQEVLFWRGQVVTPETRVKPVTVRVTLFVWSGHEQRSRIPPLYCLRIGLVKPIWVHVKLFSTNASTCQCFFLWFVVSLTWIVRILHQWLSDLLNLSEVNEPEQIAHKIMLFLSCLDFLFLLIIFIQPFIT